jgi:hypothetical protein
MKYLVGSRGSRYSDFERSRLWICPPGELWLLDLAAPPGGFAPDAPSARPPAFRGRDPPQSAGPCQRLATSEIAAALPPPIGRSSRASGEDCPKSLAASESRHVPAPRREPLLLMSTSPVTTSFVSAACPASGGSEQALVIRLRLILRAALMGVKAQLIPVAEHADFLDERFAVFANGRCELRFQFPQGCFSLLFLRLSYW